MLKIEIHLATRRKRRSYMKSAHARGAVEMILVVVGGKTKNLGACMLY